MLSILIPVFNYDIRPLTQQIHHQLTTENIEFEILLADDCSTNTVLKSQNKTNLLPTNCQLFEFDANKGRTATRQFLAKKARYSNLLFLDADVLPKSEDFMAKIIKNLNRADVIFGGIAYHKNQPKKEKLLRWKYGRERESKSIENRLKTPYLSIISGAFCIKKSLFLKANPKDENAYGLDILFIKNLKREKAKILHIDNSVFHCGLETGKVYLQKTIKGLNTLVQLEKAQQIPDNQRPIQKAYLKLKKTHLQSVFKLLIKTNLPSIEKNLLSSHPSLFWFDLYKLYYFVLSQQACK